MPDKNIGNLTTKSYWDGSYIKRNADQLCVDGFRYRNEAKMLDVLKNEIINSKSVLEIGAGDSLWLPFLAEKFGKIDFTGLDYSELGCEQLRRRVQGLGVNVICEDFLKPRSQMAQRYDLIFSFGVVEHFESLTSLLMGFRDYLNVNGRIVTFIPNMSSFLGWLTKNINREVFLLHNPHALTSFVSGHKDAGFNIMSAGYLGTTGFDVLSSCVNSDTGLKYHIYLWLSRLTKGISLIEEKTADFPATQFLSPYIYCVAQKKDI